MSERKVNRRGLFGNLLRGVADEVARTPVGVKEVIPKDASGGHVGVQPATMADSVPREILTRTGASVLPGDAGARHANVVAVPAGLGTPPLTNPDGSKVDRVARIQPVACIAYRGSICPTCVEVCPEPGAITVHLGRPTIVSETCTGCGDCVERCPAPMTAITVHSRR